MQDPYKVLGISPDASDDEIKQAYRRLAKQYHPDRNPGDETAAKKMQEINAAYEQIKNPEKAQQQPGGGYGTYGGYGSYGGYGGYSGGYGNYGGYGSYGYGQSQNQQSAEDPYQRAAYNYLRYGKFQEALNALASSTQKDAKWYYLSAIANDGLGNQVTALEHMRRAVSMEPDNPQYLRALQHLENGGQFYREQAGNFRGFAMRGSPCLSLCLCLLVQRFCCGC